MLIANQLFFSASDHFLPIKTRQETEEQECLYFHRCVLLETALQGSRGAEGLSHDLLTFKLLTSSPPILS